MVLNTKKFFFQDFIVIIWIHSFLLIAPQLLTTHRFVLEGFLTTCSFDYLSKNLFTTIMIMNMFVFGFLLPLLIIIIFYTAMFIKLRSNDLFLSYHVRFTQENSSSINVNSDYKDGIDISKFEYKSNTIKIQKIINKSCTSLAKKNKAEYLIMQREQKLIKMILIMVMMFCVAWLPYSFTSLYAQFGNNVKSYVTPLTTSAAVFFAKSSSVYNPFIYTLTNQNCRKCFKRYFCGSSEKKNGFNSNSNKLMHRVWCDLYYCIILCNKQI